MAEIQILNKEVLSDRTYKLEHVRFQKPDRDGKLEDEENEVYYRPDAVAVLLVERQHCKVLLMKQFRLPAYLNGSDTGNLIEVCAGMIGEAESAEQAARREVLEETGYNIRDLVRIGGAYSSAGGLTEYVSYFIAEYQSGQQSGQGGGSPDEIENIKLVELSFDVAGKMLQGGEFHDAKTMLLLQDLFLYGKIRLLQLTNN